MTTIKNYTSNPFFFTKLAQTLFRYGNILFDMNDESNNSRVQGIQYKGNLYQVIRQLGEVTELSIL